MDKEIILDIGIGRGGDYIDRVNAMRVGFDIDFDALNLFTKKQGTSLCQGDAETSEKSSLPFASHSFHHVDIILPHGELLFALTQSDAKLWNELFRVTNGDVTVIVDVPRMGLQGTFVHNQRKIIDMPQIRIIDTALQAGFTCSGMEKMTPDDMEMLGTEFSKWLAKQMKTYYTNAYKITVKK